jgi:hypothetical protein
VTEHDDDPRYEVKDEKLTAVLRDIAAAIDKAIKEADPKRRLGFGLFLFEFAPGDAMFWITNAERESISLALRKFLAREGQQ